MEIININQLTEYYYLKTVNQAIWKIPISGPATPALQYRNVFHLRKVFFRNISCVYLSRCIIQYEWQNCSNVWHDRIYKVLPAYRRQKFSSNLVMFPILHTIVSYRQNVVKPKNLYDRYDGNERGIFFIFISLHFTTDKF